jgi:glycosyltransferase involved in cell wall biosynthesis
MAIFEGKKLLVLARASSGSLNGPNGATHRIINMAERLRHIGFHVSILWLCDIHEYLRFKSSWLSKAYSNCLFFPVLPFYRSYILARISRFISKFGIKIIVNTFDYDLIQAENALAGSLCAFLKGKKIIVDFHGDLIAEMIMRNDSKWKMDFAFYEQEQSLRISSAILTASNGLIDLLHERHSVFPKRSLSVPCGVDVTRFCHAAINRLQQRKQLLLENRIVFCYLGGLQKWQNVDETISLFERIYILDTRAYLLIITNSDLSDFRKKLRNIGNCGEVYSFMSLSIHEIPTYLPVADFGFLLRSQSLVNRVASPTKFGEYLAAGVPVITTPFAGDAPQIVGKSECGFIIEDVDSSISTNLLTFISRSMKQRERLFAICRDVALANHSWHSTERSMENLYRDVMSRQ